MQRYGFHGLSYEYIASVLPHLAPEIANGRVIVAHLGSGSSLCALRNGRSVDSTFGFTALDGLCMGTRPGGIDPGVVLFLFQGLGLAAKDVETMLSDMQARGGPGSPVPGTWRHRTKDGTLIDVEITAGKVLFEGRPAALVLSHDVTERDSGLYSDGNGDSNGNVYTYGDCDSYAHAVAYGHSHV